MVLSLGRDGQARRRRRRCRSRSPSRSGLLAGIACGCDQRRPHHLAASCRPSSSRSAPGASSARSTSGTRRARRSGSRTSRRRRPSCSSWAPPIKIGRRAADLRLDPDARCSPCWSGTCSTAPPSAGTSTPPATTPTRRGSPASDTDRTLIAVYTIAGLICAVAGWVLIGRIGAVSPHLGRHRQPRFDHRRGDRRHQPVRRPRLDRRHAGRRADRRRVPQRPGARRASTCSGRSSPSAC